MSQPRSFALSFRDSLMLIAGVLLSLLLRRSSTELRAASPTELGLACGEWVMQTDQGRAGAGGDFDAFILNVKTGELRRTRGGGKEMSVLIVTK